MSKPFDQLNLEEKVEWAIEGLEEFTIYEPKANLYNLRCYTAWSQTITQLYERVKELEEENKKIRTSLNLRVDMAIKANEIAIEKINQLQETLDKLGR